MSSRAYAGRYAQAVFEIALETKGLDRWQSDLEKIVKVVGDAAFVTVLESPKLHFDDKAKLLTGQLKKVNPLALNLVLLLVSKGRLYLISGITEEYQRLLDSHRGIEVAEVTTAAPLDDENKQKLIECLGAIVGKRVVLRTEIDHGLLGGIVARIGGKLLDGSTRSKLMALKRELVGGRG